MMQNLHSLPAHMPMAAITQVTKPHVCDLWDHCPVKAAYLFFASPRGSLGAVPPKEFPSTMSRTMGSVMTSVFLRTVMMAASFIRFAKEAAVQPCNRRFQEYVSRTRFMCSCAGVGYEEGLDLNKPGRVEGCF